MDLASTSVRQVTQLRMKYFAVTGGIICSPSKKVPIGKQIAAAAAFSRQRDTRRGDCEEVKGGQH